jgi:diguanylate cyclase (GGDEF)-like protein
VSHEEDRTPPALPLPVEPGRRFSFLVSICGPHFGQVFPLDSGRKLVLGRKAGADVELHDVGVSRRHALLDVGQDGGQITDLSTLNGTWVNGHRVTMGALADGDRISVGAHTVLKFVHTDAQEARYLLQLAEAPRLDPVTGMPHGGVLQERLEAELSAAGRRGRTVSLLAVGVDDLHALVERHGLRTGDDVQRIMAFAVQGTLRREDHASSYGGGRVLVLAREADPDSVRALARRIREAVLRTRFGSGENDLRVTVSIGVATIEGMTGSAVEEAGSQLIEAAWTALGKAQQRGRGQVSVQRAAVA